MLKIVQVLIFTLSTLFIFVQTSLADFQFTVPQTTIGANQEVEANITLSLNGRNNTIYYLEGAFKKEGGDRYFGFTWNGTDWIEYGSDNFNTLKQITTSPEGSWSGKLKVKLDLESEYFAGNGNYILRLNRYTTSGNATPSDNTANLTIIDAPTSTPTDAPEDNPDPTDAPTPTPTKTSSPTTPPTKAPTKTPTKAPTKKPTPSPATEPLSEDSSSILGASASATETPTPTTPPTQTASFFSFSNLLIGAGVLVLILSAVFGYTFLAQKKINRL